MRRFLAVCVVWLSLVGVAPESRAQFCPGVSPWVFDDVPASDPFCGFITKMAQQNVSLGCAVIDANHRLYCPNDNVSRKQMAAFMSRLGDALFPLNCGTGQVMKWNGVAWVCASDNGGAGGGGTVTSVLAGTGLTGTPNPITGAGMLGIAAGYQLPQACSNGQVPKSNGSGGWACGADAVGAGTVTSVAAGTGLTGGTITSSGTMAVDTVYVQRRVSASCAVGSSIRAIAADGTVTCQVDNAGQANALVQNGNSFTATVRMGSTDFHETHIIAGNKVGMRIVPSAFDSPSVFGGHGNNSAYSNVIGATVAGGGAPGTSFGTTGCIRAFGCINGVTDYFGTIGGGIGNVAGDGDNDSINSIFATVGGGLSNWAAAVASTVGGGWENRTTGWYTTVGGGRSNEAQGPYSTIAGGYNNTTYGWDSFVAGGAHNVATGARTFAAGVDADADSDGCVVFANGHTTGGVTSCGGPNRFVVRAFGGYFLFTGLGATGAYLAPGASAWGVVSDRESKTEAALVDTQQVLERLVSIPISTWRWNAEESGSLHMGPMAQDFHAAFGLGDSDKRIVTVDADGVALAAIQGLNAKLESELRERDVVIAAMQAQIAELLAARSLSGFAK